VVTIVARPPERIDGDGMVLRRHTLADETAASVAFQRQRLREVVPKWESGTEYTYLLLDEGEDEVLGIIGLHSRIGPGALEIGYRLRPTHGGRGLMTAAVRALAAAALGLPGITRLEIHCDEANTPSCAIPERLGFTLQGIVDHAIEAPAETGRRMVWVLEDIARLS
jgi:RimJ/RimL family protein N-acetyltransferase